jgi:hypothetical protein
MPFRMQKSGPLALKLYKGSLRNIGKREEKILAWRIWNLDLIQILKQKQKTH